jgi:hypothetical protein
MRLSRRRLITVLAGASAATLAGITTRFAMARDYDGRYPTTSTARASSM